VCQRLQKAGQRFAGPAVALMCRHINGPRRRETLLLRIATAPRHVQQNPHQRFQCPPRGGMVPAPRLVRLLPHLWREKLNQAVLQRLITRLLPHSRFSQLDALIHPFWRETAFSAAPPYMAAAGAAAAEASTTPKPACANELH